MFGVGSRVRKAGRLLGAAVSPHSVPTLAPSPSFPSTYSPLYYTPPYWRRVLCGNPGWSSEQTPSHLMPHCSAARRSLLSTSIFLQVDAHNGPLKDDHGHWARDAGLEVISGLCRGQRVEPTEVELTDVDAVTTSSGKVAQDSQGIPNPKDIGDEHKLANPTVARILDTSLVLLLPLLLAREGTITI